MPVYIAILAKACRNVNMLCIFFYSSCKFVDNWNYTDMAVVKASLEGKLKYIRRFCKFYHIFGICCIAQI